MNAKEDKNSGEQWELIERSLEDADRMIYYVSKEKAEDKNDLECLKKLVKATAQIREDQKQVSNEKAKEHLSDFFEQITLMSHIIYPVTAESLRVMDDMGFWPILGRKESYKFRKFYKWSWLKLIFLFVFAISVGLVFTPKFFNLSLEGALIIEKLEAALEKRIELRKALIEVANDFPPGKEEPANNPKNGVPVYTAIEIVRKVQFNRTMLSILTDELDKWNQSALCRISKIKWSLSALNPFSADTSEKCDTGKEEASEIPDKIKNIEDKNCMDSDYKELLCTQIAEMQNPDTLEKRLAIKNNALIILQSLNNCILLLLFGCCGAIAYVLRKAIQQIQNHSFTGIAWITCLRIILGTFTGFFLGYLAVNKDLGDLLSEGGSVSGTVSDKISTVTPFVFAFIGGYCIDLLFDILNRFIYAITNDEKYLPTAEQMKRKVDVSKLMDKDKDSKKNGDGAVLNTEKPEDTKQGKEREDNAS